MTHRRTIALAALVALTAALHADVPPPLYSNGSTDPNVVSLSTGATTYSGVAAPPGRLWSELQTDLSGSANIVGGFAANSAGDPTGTFRFADDFTIPSGEQWIIQGASLFAYQTGAPAFAWPFDRVTLRVWKGTPGTTGSQIVWGNTSTNRFISAAQTGIHRIFNTQLTPTGPAPDVTKAIWRIETSITDITLGPGRYWLDWQFGSTSAPTTRALVPAITLPGKRFDRGWNALQYRPFGPSSGQWILVTDPGKPAAAAEHPQDFPFVLRGIVAPPSCAGDANGDNVVNGADISILLSMFGQPTTPFNGADFNGDGIVNGADLSVLLFGFGQGC